MIDEAGRTGGSSGSEEPLPKGVSGRESRVRKFWERWNNDGGPVLSAGLAFYAALAASPLLVLVYAGSLAVIGRPPPPSKVFDPIAVVLGTQAAGTVAKTVGHSAAAKGTGGPISILALLFALAAAMGLFMQLIAALDIAYGVERPTGSKGFLGDAARAASALAIVIALAVGTSVSWRLVDRMASQATRATMGWWIGIAAGVLLLALIPTGYRYLTPKRVPWGAASVAAGVAVGIALVATLVVALYLQSGTAGALYGPAASLFVALLWLLAVSTGLVVGAEVAGVTGRTPLRPHE